MRSRIEQLADRKTERERPPATTLSFASGTLLRLPASRLVGADIGPHANATRVHNQSAVGAIHIQADAQTRRWIQAMAV